MLGRRLAHRSSAQIFIEGEVTGDGLTVNGPSVSVHLLNGENSFEGETVVRRGRLVLADQGTLGQSKRLVIESQVNVVNVDVPLQDRIPDDTVVVMRGGGFAVRTNRTTPVNEVVGALVIERGHSRIDADRTPSDPMLNRVTFASLRREDGTSVNFTPEYLGFYFEEETDFNQRHPRRVGAGGRSLRNVWPRRCAEGRP